MRFVPGGAIGARGMPVLSGKRNGQHEEQKVSAAHLTIVIRSRGAAPWAAAGPRPAFFTPLKSLTAGKTYGRGPFYYAGWELTLPPAKNTGVASINVSPGDRGASVRPRISRPWRLVRYLLLKIAFQAWDDFVPSRCPGILVCATLYLWPGRRVA